MEMSFGRANEIMDDHSHVSHLSIIGQCRANCRIMQPKPLNWVNNGYGALLATVYIQTTLRELPNALFVVYGIKKKNLSQ